MGRRNLLIAISYPPTSTFRDLICKPARRFTDSSYAFWIVSRKIHPSCSLELGEHGDQRVLSPNVFDQSRKRFHPDFEPTQCQLRSRSGSEFLAFCWRFPRGLFHLVS